MADLEKIIRDAFPQRSIVIVGDLVADQFLNGTISRVSREAPVFILRHDTTATVPGAAANAAANIASLGGRPILVGVAGTDANGDKLIETLNGAGVSADHVVRSEAFTTTTKVRVLAGQHYAARQQVIRIDYENSTPLSVEVKEKLRRNLAAAAGNADAIIISDYGCGAVFAEIFEDARKLAVERRIPLIVDSRYGLENYAGATAATPNREEVESILGEDFSADDCAELRSRLGFQALLVTHGNQGMTLFDGERAATDMPAIGSAEPVDVTGAGDTVIASFALALAAGMNFAEAANIANHAGGIVVMKKGTATVTAGELLDSLSASTQPLASTHAK